MLKTPSPSTTIYYYMQYYLRLLVNFINCSCKSQLKDKLVTSLIEEVAPVVLQAKKGSVPKYWGIKERGAKRN